MFKPSNFFWFGVEEYSLVNKIKRGYLNHPISFALRWRLYVRWRRCSNHPISLGLVLKTLCLVGSISIRGRAAPLSASQQRQHPTANRCHFLISLWFSKQHKASIHNLHKSSLNTCTVALGQTRDILWTLSRRWNHRDTDPYKSLKPEASIESQTA